MCMTAQRLGLDAGVAQQRHSIHYAFDSCLRIFRAGEGHFSLLKYAQMASNRHQCQFYERNRSLPGMESARAAMEMIVNWGKHRMDEDTNGCAAEQPCWQLHRLLRERANAWASGWHRLLRMAWRIAGGLIDLVRWLLSLFARRKALPAYTGPRMHAVRRLAAGWGDSGGNRHPLAKPDWVKSAVLQLTHDLPNAGCRTLSNSFNLAHAPSGQRVSKTWVASLLKARAAALALTRRKSRRRSRSAGSGEPIQRVWGVDLTGLPLKSGEAVDVWAIVDHGSRTVLQLAPVAKFNSLILLGKLLIAFGEYGLPKAIRCDNASVFRTAVFRAILKLLGVRQQFTALHSPWQNGRIERFWKTLKETLGTKPVRFREGIRVIQEQMRFASIETMQSVLSEFRDFYNHSRPHQSLAGQTPAMVRSGQVAKRREKKSQISEKTAKAGKREAARRAARAPPAHY
jgi:putative transposase